MLESATFRLSRRACKACRSVDNECAPALRGRIRFVSMSFDVRIDTPDTMRLYGDAELRSERGLQ